MSSRPLKRRSHLANVRKSDIRVVPNDHGLPVAQSAFVPAQSTGSGDTDDLCYQRLETWLHVVDDYLEFFKSMVAAELDLATVYARIGDILKVPLPENAMVLPVDGDGIQGVTWKLKSFQQLMVENHCSISQETKKNTLTELTCLRQEVKKMADCYVASIHPVHETLVQCKQNIRKRSELLDVAIAAASDVSQCRKEAVKDPFIINLEIEALMRKRAEIENRLYATSVTQQVQIKQFESQFIDRLSAAVGDYMNLVSTRHKRLRLTAKQDVHAISTLDAAAEWSHFSTAFENVLGAPQSTNGKSKPDDYPYPGKDSDWIRVLRQGVIALKEHGPLFRSTWQSKYGVLTTRGYFHVFRSQGDVVKGAPETSVFLPRAHIAMARSGTLQISSGSRFNRCRIIIQDGTTSLDNWRLLMESVCYRNTSGLRFAVVDPGLATPPESSADESTPSSQEKSTARRVRVHRSAQTRSSRRRSLAMSGSRKSAVEGIAATPTRRGRPFSVDTSMLAQSPLGYGHFSRPVSFTPTQDIYMQPLGNTPGPTADTPLNQLSFAPALHMSPIVNVDEMLGLGGYSPDFTDSLERSGMVLGKATPASSRGSSDDAFEKSQVLPANSVDSSSSSGVPHQPESLFERNMSQDTETAPIASLPRLHAQASPEDRGLPEPYKYANGHQKDYCASADCDFRFPGRQRYCFEPSRGARSDTGYDQGVQGWDSSSVSSSGPGSSIVDLHRSRQFSSSAGYMPHRYGFSADIWHSDVLSIPDPDAKLGGETLQRPRSMIYQTSSSSGNHDAILDPTNPYLGEFLAKRNMRSTRVESRASTISTSQQTTLWRESGNSNMSGSAPSTKLLASSQYRVVSQPIAMAKSSPPLAQALSVGAPCPFTASDAYNSIPESAYEGDDTRTAESPSSSVAY